jgi:manganese transport protein
VAWLIASALIYLNIRLVFNEASDYFAVPGNIFWKIMIIIAGLLFGGLLVYILFFPFRKKAVVPSVVVHKEPRKLEELQVPEYNRIAVALDFSTNDEKLLRYALGQGNANAHYILIHIVESASARMLGKESDDMKPRPTKRDCNCMWNN